MTRLHTFTDIFGDKLHIQAGDTDQLPYALVAEYADADDPAVAIEAIEIGFTKDDIIEFAEKLLALVAEEGE